MMIDNSLNIAMDTAPRDSQRVREAARDFEALLIAQMLRAARENSAGEENDNGSTDSIRELAEQQIAQCLASAGGLGLSSLISQGLASKPPASAGVA